MDEGQIRQLAQAHVDAVIDPIDVPAIQADLIEELHPALPQIAALLPQPVTSASVDSVEAADDHAIAHVTYRGDSASLSIRQRWEDRGGSQPQIVEAAPVG
jgi:hypothetical protein